MAESREIDFNGWLLIGASTVGVAVCVIPVSILAMGVFIKPLGDEFGWGRGEVALALTILSFAMAGALPVAGRLIDRFGVHRPLIGSQILYGAGVAATPWALDAGGLTGLYLVALWLGIAGSASSSVAYVKILSSWFDKSRGLALGFAMSGIALGGAIAPLFAAMLIETFDWRAGFWGLALLPTALGIPMALSIREPPQSDAAAAARPLPGMNTFEATRTRAFWLLFLLFLVAATAIHGIQIHLAPLLSDRGLAPEQAALGVSFMFGISVLARLIAGYMFDRVFAPYVGAFCFFAACIGAGVLVPETTPAVYLGAVALLGVGAGAESDLMAMLVSRYFGLKAFGTIYGWIFGSMMAGSALGPFFLGIGYDSTGSYASVLVWCTAGLALTVLLLLALPRFPSWDVEPAEAPPVQQPTAMA